MAKPPKRELNSQELAKRNQAIAETQFQIAKASKESGKGPRVFLRASMMEIRSGRHAGKVTIGFPELDAESAATVKRKRGQKVTSPGKILTESVIRAWVAGRRRELLPQAREKEINTKNAWNNAHDAAIKEVIEQWQLPFSVSYVKEILRGARRRKRLKRARAAKP